MWIGLVTLLLLQAWVASINFLPDSSPEFAEWRKNYPDWFDDRCSYSLSITGIRQLHSGPLFLHGDVDAVGPHRSLLARSEDGGRSWAEVMAPVVGSYVVDLSFVSNLEGYALVGWGIEGPGALFVYATFDAGRTWRRVSEIRKPHNLDVPRSLGCDGRRCAVPLECANVDGLVHVMETNDSGRHWREKGRPGPKARPPADNARMASGDVTTDTWRVAEGDDGTTVAIMRRVGGAWGTVVTLERSLQRTDSGQLVPCSRETR